jgi:hypothetical protein
VYSRDTGRGNSREGGEGAASGSAWKCSQWWWSSPDRTCRGGGLKSLGRGGFRGGRECRGRSPDPGGSSAESRLIPLAPSSCTPAAAVTRGEDASALFPPSRTMQLGVPGPRARGGPLRRAVSGGYVWYVTRDRKRSLDWLRRFGPHDASPLRYSGRCVSCAPRAASGSAARLHACARGTRTARGGAGRRGAARGNQHAVVDETCPLSTGGRTRRVQSVRGLARGNQHAGVARVEVPCAASGRHGPRAVRPPPCGPASGVCCTSSSSL